MLRDVAEESSYCLECDDMLQLEVGQLCHESAEKKEETVGLRLNHLPNDA